MNQQNLDVRHATATATAAAAAAAAAAAERGEHGSLLYDYTLRIVSVVEYGASFEDVLTGAAAPPPAGLRVDIAFEGESRGVLTGSIRGVDYLTIRGDGGMELNIHAELTTPSGDKIALAAGGVGLPQPGSTRSLLREHVRLATASPAYEWLNPLEIWGIGEADIATGRVHVRGYLP